MSFRVYTIDDIKRFKKLLRIPGEDVVEFNDELKNIIEEMLKTIVLYRGIGLSATQVGLNKKIVVINNFPKDQLHDIVEFPLVLINPKYKSISNEKVESIEGCLSLPRRSYKIKRFKTIFVSAKNLNGEQFSFEANDLLSFCVQHECDHLNGKLLCDIRK